MATRVDTVLQTMASEITQVPEAPRPAHTAAPVAGSGDAPPRRRRTLLRMLVVLFLTAGTLLLLSAILTDVEVKDAGAALVSAALIGLVNALVWPLVIRLALPLTVLTLGLGVVALNGAMVLLVAAIAPGLEVDSLSPA